jgi:GNAT superfamily N-acetyltransferase
MLQIRDCALDDADALFGLFLHWDRAREFGRSEFMESLPTVLADPELRILVAIEGDSLCGYAQLSERRNLGHKPSLRVDQLLVDDAKRSAGIGGALMARIEEIARERGFATVSLHSQVHRSRAHVFYERQGYELRKISKYYEKLIG